jgi:radical SAM protein
MQFKVDYNEAPLLVIWEVTRSCALACRHCRASAIDWRHPEELTTEEGYKLLDDIKKMGTPLVVFTGGDPLQRDDLEELITYAKKIGLRAGTIPASTPRLTRERIQSLKAAGIDQLALSLDGATAASHDGFRRVPGSFEKVMEAARWIKEEGIPLQINTVFAEWNAGEFDQIADLVEQLGVVFWEVFFLVPTGRGTELSGCEAGVYEELFGRLYQRSLRVPYIIKVTEGPHYRRYVAQQQQAARREGAALPIPAAKPMEGARPRHPGMGITKTYPGVNAGKGFAFIDHIGEVYPSGFLPIECGSIRDQSIIDIYRTHPLFLELRQPDQLHGKCGICTYRTICGGSRARAYAVTGNHLAEDPCCDYQPADPALAGNS